MAAPFNPPKKGEDFEFDAFLEDWRNPGKLKANPTLAAGDVKVVKDNGAEANINTLPSVAPAAGVTVDVLLSSTEMNADKVSVIFRDQTVPPEWAERAYTIITQA